MGKIPIHYDCDTGQDDAIALLYALGSDNIDVRSISVVGGNVDVEQCARNTLQILELAGREDIPVYIGANKPLKRPLKMLPEVFGVTGMAGGEDMPLPKASPLQMEDADDFRKIIKYDVMVATGPLTNLALNIMANSNFTKVVKHLVVMGGSAYPEPVHGRLGNIKVDGSDDYAEYNFAVDPEAAKIVFSAGIKKITMIGLNVTRTVLYNHKIEKILRDCRTKCTLRAAQILSSVGDEDLADYADVKEFSNDPVRALHDVVAMVCLDCPEIFTFEELPIRICVGDAPLPSGQTVIDFLQPDKFDVQVAVGVDKDMFYEKMVATLKKSG